jgi:GT2 family glycosyltransferase
VSGGQCPVSVIVTTYRSPDPLRLVLAGLRRQSHPADQVIVAEDGRWEVNRQVVDAHRAGWPGQLIHTTQADIGFRLNASRNRGVAATQGDYVILIDGDMVPHHHFVADHLAFARRGCFVQSHRVRLGLRLTAQALRDKRLSFPWWTPGVQRRHKALRFPVLARQLSRRDQSLRHTRGANMAFWRRDLVAINGFDMQYEGWGFDDTDTAARLLHAGIERMYLRHAALAYHLFHPESSPTQGSVNRQRYEQTLATRRIRCDVGLEQLAQMP